MATFLAEREVHIEEGSNAARALAALVSPADITHSVLISHRHTRLLTALLLTERVLVYGELPIGSHYGFGGGAEDYEPIALWVRPRSEVCGAEVPTLRLHALADGGVAVVPTFRLKFRDGESLQVRTTTSGSRDDADALVVELLSLRST